VDTGSADRPAGTAAGRWLLAALAALTGGIAATAIAIAIAEDVHDLRQHQCQHGYQPITATMPWYAVPLAAGGGGLLAVAGGLATIGYLRAAARRDSVRKAGAALLVVVAVLGTLIALWLGVYSIVAEIPIEPSYCVG
jgi:Na+/H+ antiporter NhaD/arsenite permease-like protein